MGEHDDEVDLVVVGAGFAGLYMLHRARGLGLRTRVFEAGSGVGGTWYWNRYPGARCDIESLEYSYSFDADLQQEWEWTERYATQPEILAYLEHVADRFDLRRDITLDTRVERVHWHAEPRRWHVATDTGERVAARFVVLATGCLSSPVTPTFPGIADYGGRLLHTGRWPHEPVDFTGERVAVIGTGSSGIQAIPVIADQADHLTVYQRTPNYAVPAHNRPLDPAEVAEVKAHYDELRAANREMMAAYGARLPRNDVAATALDDDARRAELERRWDHGGLPFLGAFNDVLLDPRSNVMVADFVREQIAGVVDDPELAQALSPTTTIGCKRLCVDTGYYATYNRPHVELVDLAVEPIERFTVTGVVSGSGEREVAREFDSVVLATGFDAMTGTIMKLDLRGRDGMPIQDAWSDGPRTYLGLQVAGFPNLFLVTGPGSPSVLTNMVVSIEHHVDWIADAITALATDGCTTIEPTLAAQDRWVAHVNAVADLTLFPTCDSWYLGANVPGKERVFMPLLGFPPYVEQVAQVVADGYRGFERE